MILFCNGGLVCLCVCVCASFLFGLGTEGGMGWPGVVPGGCVDKA